VKREKQLTLHTHVSELLQRSESVVDVARRIGDRPDVILRTYAHFIPGSECRIAKSLDESYGRKSVKVELRWNSRRVPQFVQMKKAANLYGLRLFGKAASGI
jgi:hypothetical protein